MKVLIIDPWCSDTGEVYTIGLCDGLSKIVDTTLISSFYETRKDNKYKIFPVFFRYSDRMNKRNKLRLVIRGLEYIVDYCKILHYVKQESFDVIHIEWALFYKIDNFFDKFLKKRCNKLVYTSHNVLPHINGERYIENLKKLHRNFDAIIVHGERIRQKYMSLFPEDKDKVYIQRHGIHFTQKTQFDINNIDKRLIDFINNRSSMIRIGGKLIVCVGGIYYNKGTDRVVNFWNNHEINSNNKLIVAGKVIAAYKELEVALKESINENMLFLPRYLNDDEYSYVIYNADVLAIPYRDASMSGIVYSAAAFSKPIVYTNTGSLYEYVGDEGGFVAENTDIDFVNVMNYVIKRPVDELKICGWKLHERIYKNYNWDEISVKLVNEVYRKDKN